MANAHHASSDASSGRLEFLTLFPFVFFAPLKGEELSAETVVSICFLSPPVSNGDVAGILDTIYLTV